MTSSLLLFWKQVDEMRSPCRQTITTMHEALTLMYMCRVTWESDSRRLQHLPVLDDQELLAIEGYQKNQKHQKKSK